VDHGSGPGSLHAVNRPFIDFLTNFIHNNDVHSIVDFGCGDWQYMKSVDLSGVRYLGLDVVDDVLSMVRKRHGRSNISFARTPENLADIPEGDLIIFKDVLIHLGNSYVAQLLNLARWKFRFVLSINNYSAEPLQYNTDIEHGGFRPLDIGRAPFGFPCATVLSTEFCGCPILACPGQSLLQ